MPRRIDSLKIENFRGATCPVAIDFDDSKNVTMIFGENGTGKSSIVDAMDFVCNEQIGSISERSSVNPKSHLPALGKDSDSLKVILSSGSQKWGAKWGKRAPETTGPKPCFTARILRRNKILETVNDEPKKRYEALRGFIEVPRVEQSEKALRRLTDDIAREFDDATKARNQAEQGLKDAWEKERKQGTGFVQWAEQLAARKPDEVNARIKECRGLIRQHQDAASAHNQWQETLKKSITDQITLATAEKQLQVVASKVIQRQQELVEVLKAAKNFFKANAQAKTCPVCEQGIDDAKVTERIDARLAEMRELVAATDGVQTAKKKVDAAVAVSQTAADKAVKETGQLVKVLLSSKIADIQTRNADWTSHSKTLEDAVKNPTALHQAIIALLQEIENTKPTVEKQIRADEAVLNQQGIISTLLGTLKQKTQSAKELEQLSQRLAAILQVVEAQRKAYVEGILSSISADVESMYTRIHPNEGLGGIHFYLREKAQGSLEFDGTFQGTKDVPPQAYYSDAHMDTLGICVFLAMAKLFNDENTIVVLDDVVTSADQAHMDRFMNMLHDEAKHFNQLIITTHYRPWRDRYRFARGPAAQVQLIELLHWSVPRGIRHTRTKLGVEELADHAKVEPVDRQAVSSKAGILLESMLDHLALLYACKLPRKAEPNYTLGDLTDCIGKKLRKALKTQSVDASTNAVAKEIILEALLNDITGMNWIRNQVGCHWNINGLAVPDNDIKAFADKTIEFAQALICDGCGELPRKDDSGIHWACRCSQKRLLPLQNPD